MSSSWPLTHLQVVHETAGRGDDDVRVVRERGELLVHAVPADKKGHP